MLTGSVAASYHGCPRATHDADLVIDPTPAQLDDLVEGLAAAGFYVDPNGAREALRRRAQFNAIETRYACKIDLIVRRDRPFSEAEFARRVTADCRFGRDISIVMPEDAILSKLEWARKSGDSENSWRMSRECWPSINRSIAPTSNDGPTSSAWRISAAPVRVTLTRPLAPDPCAACLEGSIIRCLEWAVGGHV